MQLSAVAPFGFKDFPEPQTLAFIREQGIVRVHVVRDYEHTLPAQRIRRMLDDQGMAAESFHAEHGPQVDLSSPDASIRQKAVDLLAREAEVALGIGATVLVAHSAGAEAPFDPARSQSLRQGLQTLDAAAEQMGVRFLIENMPPSYAYGQDTGQLARDIQAVDSPRIGLCFDTGHAHMVDRAPARHILGTKGFLHYIHAHDNDGDADQHLLPMTGAIDWPPIGRAIRQINADPIFCLEVFESIKMLRKKLTPSWWQNLRGLLNGRAE
ncbi:MAG: sugar phosphate isomerase/epimerase [Phycisphaerae bacterium]|nr:sugar phosphate isomerase/epimerase [Phycisphaerae bacterium]